jgi:hypothetical protein
MNDAGTSVSFADGVINICFKSVHTGTANNPASSNRLNQSQRVTYLSRVTSSEVKNMWSYISIHPNVFVMCTRTACTVLPYSNLSMSWSVHVGFVADTVAMGLFFSCSLVLLCHCHSTNAPYEYCTHPLPTLHNPSNRQRRLTNQFSALSPCFSLSLSTLA